MKTKFFFAALMLLFCATSLWADNTFCVDGIWYNFKNSTMTATVIHPFSHHYEGNVTIPASVTYGDAVYSVTSIGNYAFKSCSGLTSIEIPNSVTSIGEGAFDCCQGMTSVTIPSSVTSIGKDAFRDWSRLTKVNITDIAAWCNIVFGNEYANPLQCAKHLFLNDVEVTDLVIPNSVTSIGDYAFYGLSSLTSVTIQDSVTSIGFRAFFATGLTSVTIPYSVTNIGDEAFTYCENLTSVTINSNAIAGRDYRSDNCLNRKFGRYINECIIGDSVKEIGWKAFMQNYRLETLTIGKNVKYVGMRSFQDCTNLKVVTCEAITPPGCNNSSENGSFLNVVKSKIPLYVPKQSIAAYKNASVWSEFTPILAIGYVEYTVKFVDWNGAILKTEQVEKGHSATAPADPSRKGYTFIGWDKDFSNVNADMTVNAQYEQIKDGINDIYQSSSQSTKLLRDGQLFIQKAGKTYTIQGIEVK